MPAPAAAAASATADADTDAGAPKPPRLSFLKGKKKLLLIIAAAVLLLAVAGGGATWFVLNKRTAQSTAAVTDDEDGEPPAAQVEASEKPHRKGPPTFTPLDPFTVNLADREAERYAQVGITLELEDAKHVELVKQYMPAIRNNILLALAQRTSAELLGREGKLKLAEEIRREALRALSVEPNDDEQPVRAVQFSNFIVQ